MGLLIADKFKQWEQKADERFYQLKANEEELNRIFIDIYGMQDELTIAKARMDYLHPLQRKYEAEIKRLELLKSETEDNRATDACICTKSSR